MNSTVESSTYYEIQVEELYKFAFWSDFPAKQGFVQGNRTTVLSFTLFCRNLGNTYDEILVQVPADLFCGEYRDWLVKFGPQSHYTFKLESLVLIPPPSTST